MPPLWAQRKLNLYILSDTHQHQDNRRQSVAPTPSVAAPQRYFNTRDPILNPLDTSAELDEYMVEDVNLNDSTVKFMHGNLVQEGFITTVSL